MKKSKRSPRVVVAMSGGVDSSVAAALLLEKGYDVIGATIKLWSKEECITRSPKSCCSLRGIEDAKSVANKLGIPHYVFSLQKQFKDKVIDYFYLEYSNGRTPNPCIRCNERIKFGVFLNKALGLGAEFVATGHYATINYDRARRKYILREARDKSKDQSYVLFSLNQSQLARVILPLGRYTKVGVRTLAKKLGLKVHDKAESQEICFINDNDYRIFLQKKMDLQIEPGAIVDKEGNILGEHRGIHSFTVGQRRGLGIAKGVPLYVLRIDKAKNRVIVGCAEDARSNGLVAESLNWIVVDQLNGPMRLEAKIRSRHPKAWATVSRLSNNKVNSVRSKTDMSGTSNGVKVEFDQPQSAITPGQAVVFYDRDVVVGGGWIK